MDDPFAFDPPSDSPEPDRSAKEDAAALEREREWLLSRLREIRADRARLEDRERDFALGARVAGIGWDAIGEALGVTADEALAKFGEPPEGEAPFLLPHPLAPRWRPRLAAP